MKKTRKILLWIAGGLIVLIVAAIIGLKLYLTKDRILAWVIPPLEQTLHRKVTIKDAGAGFTGIYLDGLDVRAEGAAEPLVSARELRIRWNLWALLKARVQVDEVRLVEPSIHIVRRADGTLDVDDLLAPKGSPKEKAAPGPEAPTGGGAAKVPLAVQVGVVSIENGKVVYEDRSKTPARTYALDAIDLRVTDMALDRPFRYELSARLPLQTQGRFSIAGTMDLSTRDVTAKARVEHLDLPSLNPLLGGATKVASGVSDVDLDVKLSKGKDADVKGSITATKLALSSQAGAGKPFDLSVQVEAGAKLGEGTAALRRLDVTAAGQTLHLTGKVSGLKARPRIDFALDSPELRADALTALLPPSPKTAEKPAPGKVSRPKPAGKPSPIPADVYGDLRVGRLLAGGLTIEKFAARIEVEKGVLRIQPATASIYGGTLALGVKAELEREGPPFSAKVDLNGTQVGAVLAGLSPKLKDTMTGVLSLSLDANGVGGDLTALRSTMKAEAKDGKILNHPLVMQLAQLLQAKELETLNFYSLKVAMETAKGVGKLTSLALEGPSLRADGKGTVGLVDRKLDVDLSVAVPKDVAAKVVRQASVLASITDKQGWARLPMKLRGTLDQPKYGLDAEALARGAAKTFGEKALKKLPVGEQQKEMLEQGLQKLFGK